MQVRWIARKGDFRGSFEDSAVRQREAHTRTQELKRRKRARPKAQNHLSHQSAAAGNLSLRSTCESISLGRTSSSPSNYIIRARPSWVIWWRPWVGGGRPLRPPTSSGRIECWRCAIRLTSYMLRCHLAKVVSSHSALVFTFQGRAATWSSFSLRWESGRLP